jgi:hypothetical protein
MGRVAKKNLLKRVGATIAFLFGCSLVCYLFAPELVKEEWTLFRRKLELPGVEADFDALANDVPRSESDTILTTRNAGHHLRVAGIPQFGSGCIWGSTITIYGSTRDFEIITAEYQTLFADHEDWSGGTDRDPDYRSYGHKSGKAVFYINFYVPSDFDYSPECAGYPTCYATKLLYGDPSLRWCFG